MPEAGVDLIDAMAWEICERLEEALLEQDNLDDDDLGEEEDEESNVILTLLSWLPLVTNLVESFQEEKSELALRVLVSMAT